MGKLHHNKSIMYSFLSTILPYVVDQTRKFLKNKNRNAVYITSIQNTSISIIPGSSTAINCQNLCLL